MHPNKVEFFGSAIPPTLATATTTATSDDDAGDGNEGADSTTKQHGRDIEPRANRVRIKSSLEAFDRAINHAAIEAEQKAPDCCDHAQSKDGESSTCPIRHCYVLFLSVFVLN